MTFVVAGSKFAHRKNNIRNLVVGTLSLLSFNDWVIDDWVTTVFIRLMNWSICIWPLWSQPNISYRNNMFPEFYWIELTLCNKHPININVIEVRSLLKVILLLVGIDTLLQVKTFCAKYPNFREVVRLWGYNI